MSTVVEAPPWDEPATASSRTALVAVVKTTPESVLDDYTRVMETARYRDTLDHRADTLLKLNLSWTKYFPACSSQPWQVEGVVRTLLNGGFLTDHVHQLENKTVVTDPRQGCRNNGWEAVLSRYGLDFTALPEVDWQVYQFKSPLLKLNDIFPDGIEIPALYPGKQILHLPTVKTHGHAVTTGAVKNAFGGLLKEVRHYAHKYMHEVLVDLLYMERELHPAKFSVMDGTVCGDGAGPRTMVPRIHNYLLASSDSVAIDSVAAGMMGFDPMSIPVSQNGGGAGSRRRESEGHRGRRRGCASRELRVRDQEVAGNLGRPTDPTRFFATTGAHVAALAAGRVGAVRVERLS